MSRSGIADRKKIAALTADTTVTVANCGTIFIINSGSSLNGTYTASLPPIRAAGRGWWCKFVIGDTTGGDVLISASAGDAKSISVQKPLSRNDAAYGWGNIETGYGNMPIWAYPDSKYGGAYNGGSGYYSNYQTPWGNLPFAPGNIEQASAVRFTISSSGPNGCAQQNLAYHNYSGADSPQPSASCKINDTLELVTDGVRWYGQASLASSVALLDSNTDPCTVLSASADVYWYPYE